MLHSNPPLFRLLAGSLLTCLLASVSPTSTASALQISLKPIQTGFNRPIYLTAPSGSNDLYVVEQAGLIHLRSGNKWQKKPFLDLHTQVVSGGEMGLLSLAFHPKYQSNGRFFLNYTTGSALKTRISEWRANPKTRQVIAGSERILLEIAQPYRNHNGGQIAFGPDHKLYIGMGDGGSANDPQGHGQNRKSLLGKILRVDVDQGAPYRIPSDNPFLKQPNIRPEIWAYGLRNPWRFSFDRLTGELYAADVGQNRFEEIDLIQKGGNYGWKIREGFACFSPENNCPSGGLKAPLHVYDHSQGVSVTGGFVYRGSKYPALKGIYFFADFGSGTIWGLKQSQAKKTWHQSLLNSGLQISSFGQDGQGELYLLDYSNGRVFQIEAKTEQT
ncbi:MAG: sorbosone dehydrogenase family protein [Candidatus Sericytochromatia bacterium]